MSSSACIVFFLILFTSVQSEEICDISDVECWTTDAKHLYKTLIHGVDGLFDSLEPLRIKSFTKEIDGLRLDVSNVSFTGLGNCNPIKLKLLNHEYKYDYILRCRKLYLNAKVIANGYLGTIYIDGSDFVTIIAEDYYIKMIGQYGTFVSEEDLLARFDVGDFTMDTDPQGMITMKTNNAFGISNTLVMPAENYLKNSWKIWEKKLRYPAMRLFMSTIVNVGDIYLRATPMVKVFPKNETVCH